MLDRIAEAVAGFISRNTSQTQEREILTFGIKMFFERCFYLIVTVIAGILSHRLAEMLLFMICYRLLRESAGGYHAKSRLGCFISSLAMLAGLIVFWLTLYQEWQLAASITLFAVSCPLFVLFAPTDNPNNPMEESELKTLKKRAWIVYLTELAAAGILLAVGLCSLAVAVMSAIFVLSVMLVLGRIRNNIYKHIPHKKNTA